MNQNNQHNKHSDSRIDPITRLMYGLYSDHNLTIEEVADLFKITRQAVSLRFIRARLKTRSSGPKKEQLAKYYKWQIILLNRLTSYGLTTKQAADLLSINYGTAILRNRNKLSYRGFNNYKVQFKTPQIARMYCEFNYLILVDAWNNGATTKELSELFGSTEAGIQQLMVRLRGRKGYNLKYRREDLRRD